MIDQTLDMLKDDPSLQGHEALYSAIALDAALKRYGHTEYQVSVYGRTKSHGIRYFNGGDDYHPVVLIVHGEDEFHMHAHDALTIFGRLESMPVEDHKDMLETHISYGADVFYEYEDRTSNKFGVFHDLARRCPDTYDLLRQIAASALKRLDLDEVEGPQPFATTKDACVAFNKVFLAARQQIRKRRAKEAKDKAAKGKLECKRR